jgi:adenine-specific DNA-methyltransferase
VVERGALNQGLKLPGPALVAGMASIEDLIDAIDDDALRAAIAREVKRLKERVPFGLVFERHLPESVLLAASVGVSPGDRVRRRNAPDVSADARVVEVDADSVVVVDNHGERSTIGLDELVVVKGFNDPVYPTLTPIATVDRTEARPYHAVINGENYHALQVMLHCWERQVDCIYIDPPYNTGARDWKYNNRYVDSNDAWQHSKWLSFMEKRLRLAKGLLKDDGVLIVTIDEHEVHHLAVLLEQLFPEYLRYMVNIVINPKGTNKVNFGRVEEHALFVVPNLGRDVIAQLPPPEDQKDAELTIALEDRTGDSEGVWVRDVSPSGELQLPVGLRERLGLDGGGTPIELRLRAEGAVELAPLEDDAPDDSPIRDEAPPVEEDASVLFLRRRGAESSFRHQRPNQFYAIKVDERAREVVGVGPPLAADEEYEVGYREGDILWVYPVDEDGNERVWRYVRDTMQEYIAAGQIRVGKRWDNKPQTYTLNHYKPREGERKQRLRTTWWRPSHDAGTHGTSLISRLLGRQSPFPFPKSLYAVRDCLDAVVHDRTDALIVDFFAGSGTTLHATALLNAGDGGRRRCVLVTNNEVDERTAARLAKSEVFPGDAEYEQHGIFEAATRPRIETALTGVRPDGTPVPRGRSQKYLDGRPWADGFEENCIFLRLDYLNPDTVELGRAFNSLHPLLWLMAGARGPYPGDLDARKRFAVLAAQGYAVLFDEARFGDFAAALLEATGVDHVFLVTDSEDAYAEMCEALPPGRRTHMLYRDYLRSFRIRS